MVRKDFKPNRLLVALETAKRFIHEKFLIDPKDRIAILSFGANVAKLSSFSNEEEKLVKALERIQISGNGLLNEGLAFSVQFLVGEMRRLGGKTNRIFIISDNKLEYSDKVQKINDIVKGLGIYVDACQLGKTQDHSQSILKKIAKITGGQFGFFNNSKALLNAGALYASKKELKASTDYFSPDKKSEIAPLMSEIAIQLRRPNLLDIRLMMSSKERGQEKCQICHSVKAQITGADFYSEGRYCPSCERPMHLSCAAMWAKKTEYKENVFRCPFCFFLLELPGSASKLIEEKVEVEEPKIKLIDESGINITKMTQIPELEIDKINASCTFCHSIFLGDYNVFQCEKCGAYYHEPCLKKMHNEIKACRNCGAQITFK
ncbi:MAG: VWA domain-containing protein [Candidatus Lokiarchaeota archaeon]|nr:VWA domain-containing protein [Candidatus Lokiarchaeota archaeon]